MARYTADEMREAANAVDEVSINDNGEYFYEKHDKFNPFLVRDMLRQAADAMEREEQEKKYEYAERYQTGVVSEFHQAEKIHERFLSKHSNIVRRSVGEWEEVE